MDIAEPDVSEPFLPCRNKAAISALPGAGYCGLRRNEGGRLVGVSPEEGKLTFPVFGNPALVKADRQRL